MSQGHEQFLNFIMEKVGENDKDGIKDLLGEDFKKLKSGSFTKDDLAKTQEKLMKVVKPETVEEVKKAIGTFAATHVK